MEMMEGAMKRLFPEITISATAGSVAKAIAAIKKYNPVFIILDVELGDRLGFEVLDALSSMHFKTLFVSSHNKYMRQAFLASAVDFLEKPCKDEDLRSAVKRTLLQAENEKVNVQLERILKYIEIPMVLNARLRLVNADGAYPVPVGEIVYAEAQNNQTVFWLTNNRRIKVSHVLGDYDELLEPYNFMRIQRSFIINFEHISIYKKKGDVIMHGYDKELGIGNDYRAEFDRRYRDYTIGD